MAVEQDRFDAMSDEALVNHLEAAANERRDQLEISQREGRLGNPEWVAEIWHEGGLAGRTMLFAAPGETRRAAMQGLARLLEGT